MIGRFSPLGAFQGLFRYREFTRCLAGGALALAAWGLDSGHGPSLTGIALGLASVAINGLPIILGAAKGLLARRVNVDELVSLAILASLAQGELLTAATVSFIMGITTGSLTVLVDRLERGGYVTRMPHETDRRSIRVALTAEGRRLFTEHHTLHAGGRGGMIPPGRSRAAPWLVDRP